MQSAVKARLPLLALQLALRVALWVALWVGVSLLAAASAQAQTLALTGPALGEEVTVTTPYIELHTGPGRGYPVAQVVERGARVTLELRRTDWFRVRTAQGRVGWVPRAQLETTLTAAGAPRSLRDVLLDDYLSRRLEAGGHWGRFEGEPMLRFSAHLRLADAFGAEASFGQVQGRYAGTEFWHLNLNAEPWSDRRLSPSFGVGLGRFRNVPNLSLVDAQRTNATLATATLGLRWHLGARFVLRTDYSLYSSFVSDEQTLEFRALSAGLAFFF
jgi:hypothetical protein